MYQAKLDGMWLFAQQLCKALEDPAYIVVAKVNPDTNEVFSHGNWVGPKFTGISKATHVAPAKMGEIVLAGAGLDGKLVMTPVAGNELSFGWMGGVGQKGTIVAVSKWPQEFDRLLALLTLYHTIHEKLSLHHVGFRFTTPDEYETANASHKNGLIRPAEDHERTYFPMTRYYREHQFVTNAVNDKPLRHWDFVCEQPEKLLAFIANAYGQDPTFWKAGENDPIGVSWVEASSTGAKLGVMARRTWWDV